MDGCDDCTDEATVKAVLAGQQPQLMVTDPPYGVEYDPAWRIDRGLSNSGRTGKIRNDERADWSAAWSLFPGNIAYVWHAALRSGTVAESLTKTGFAIRNQIIWAKERLVMGRGDYHWQHEPCWYAVRSKGNWRGTGSKRRFGAFQRAARMPRRSTRPRNRPSACAGRCSTTAIPAKPSTSRSWAAGRR